MPQMIVEYSDNIKNLDHQALMLDLNHALFDTGLIDHSFNIKTRIRANQDFLIGFGDNNQAYIHVRLAIMTGRTLEQRKLISDQLFRCLKNFEKYQAIGLEVQLCVELAEMLRDVYGKISVVK
ncbi:5-carboxymethyl-2-hydroxymuconate Delta-isomerase [Acinetobacter defluvii]|uniref:5-carboxymethyl-2-hydroxymuconate Delta-isomerase n=2 Tax=Acinetobacter defluvii TaxID=1871111 RepID=A0A2S2FDC3_9GAMM|nr:5-carboxymethyl-2-hydroxymuconate Delta-isomerase [Acinetobacter defluvii]